jgi:SHS2 domain-containing protein
VQVKIPYETGMNPYSGLVELFEKKNLLVKQGNRLKYVNLAGEEVLEYRKAWMLDGRLDLIMLEYNEKMAPVVNIADAEEATVDQIEEIAIND